MRSSLVSWRAPALLLDERALDDVIALRADVRRDMEAAGVQQRGEILEHGGAAADHGAIVLGVERRQADLLEQRAAFDQGGDAAAIAIRLARDGRVVDQLVA